MGERVIMSSSEGLLREYSQREDDIDSYKKEPMSLHCKCKNGKKLKIKFEPIDGLIFEKGIHFDTYGPKKDDDNGYGLF